MKSEVTEPGPPLCWTVSPGTERSDLAHGELLARLRSRRR